MKWKKVTPLPPEFNGYGFLWYCPYCKRPISSWHSYPKERTCPHCEHEIDPVDKKGGRDG